MFHLAPVNLDQRRTAKKEHHQTIQTRVLASIKKIKQGTPDRVYTSKDVETQELFKSLDAFFCHGFIIPAKCYWRFVREFLPQSIQESLALEWNAHTERALSLSWLKNALNQQSLYFQTMVNYYDKNACIRNIPVLKKLAVEIGNLSEIQFRIENTSQHRFDAPVAQLSTQAPIVHVPSSSAIDTRSIVKSRAIQTGATDIILSASFQHNDRDFMQRFAGNRSMVELTADLPRVEVPPSAHEPFLSTTRDQDYMINEIVKTHRVRVQSYNQHISSDEDEKDVNVKDDSLNKSEEGKTTTVVDNSIQKRSLQTGSSANRQRLRFNLQDEDHSSSSSFSTTSTDDEADRKPGVTVTKDELITPTNPIKIVEELEQIDKKPVVSLHDELNNTDLVKNESNLNPECSSVSTNSADASASPQQTIGENIDGDIALSSGEIIQMSLSVFKEDVENFQRLFAVYVDHAVGHPKRRLLLLTDRYVYVLSSRAIRAGEPIPKLSRAEELSYLSSTPAMDSCSFELDEPDTNALSDSMQINYHVEVEVSLEDIDYITAGVDFQSVCIHTKMAKFKTPASDHEQKQFVVETASQMLGACIVSSIKRAVRKFTRKGNDIQIVSGTTLYSIILKNFVRRELGLNSVDLKHGALVYWLQCPMENKQTPELLEGYLFTRNFHANVWRRKADKWSQKYFMLDRSKLYQFTDSTCKGAELLLNIRERVEEVVEVELKADEKFVIELRFNDDTPNMQLSFTTSDAMRKWITSLTMILSTSIQDDLQPVACDLILTDTAILFAQEGANCQVDGFMRLLLQTTFRDIASVASLNTIRHHLLILRRESGDSEIIFLRNESELQRLCFSFANHWQLSVEELSETAAQADPIYSRLYSMCYPLHDVWSVEAEEASGMQRLFI